MNSSDEILNKKTDYRQVFFNFLKYKYVFAISVILFFVGAYFLNKLTPAIYENETTLLFSGNERDLIFESEAGPAYGSGFSHEQIENEMGILRSYTIIGQALQELNFEVSYFFEDNLVPSVKHKKSPFKLTEELYKACPFTVIFDPTSTQPVGLEFDIQFLGNNQFQIQAQGTNVLMFNYLTHEEKGLVGMVSLDGIFEFGQDIVSEQYNFKILLNENYGSDRFENGRLYFTFNHTNFQTLELMNSLLVDPYSSSSSLVSITLQGQNPYKITDFLNTYTSVYLERNLERKNRMAVNTVNFIERQIKDISDSLQYTESELQNFRASHKVMNLSFQGEQIYNKLMELENEKANLLVQAKYYNYIKKYLNNNEDVTDLAIPSSMGVEDKVLTQLITQLILKYADRDNLLNNSNKQSIFLGGIEREIQNLKKSILENVKYNLSTTNISITGINNRASSLSNQISKLPQTERELFGIQRKFDLTDAIYTYLMEKRAEAQITRAAHSADCEIIDPARYITATYVGPTKSMNYIFAILLGIGLPFIFVLFKDFLNDRIQSKKDLSRLCNFPMVGQILHNENKENLVVAHHPQSGISASFRAVPTYVKLLFEEQGDQVILVTSSLAGEGKKLVAANMAMAFSMVSKRSVLVSFDFRDPSMHSLLGLDDSIGVSNYLENSALIDDVVQPTIIDNLDFISCGPYIDNPLSIISSGKTTSFITKLREMYDHIIIDATAIGLATDTFLMMKQADVNILVVRENFTRKSIFSSIVQNIVANRIPNVALLMNDVRPSRNPFESGYELSYLEQKSNKRIRDYFFQRD